MNARNEYLIGIDIDWASDEMVAETSRILVKEGIKATWFVSHQSREIERLGHHPDLFEIGIHPNFSTDSTQGRTPTEIMTHLKRIVPASKSVRSHRLMQSTPLLKLMREQFDILYDASIHLPETPYIVPHELPFGNNVTLIRIPTFWEDGLEINKPSPSFRFKDERYHLPGIKIFIFHPVHITLNSRNFDSYSQLKESQNISDCSIDRIQHYINHKEKGIKTLFNELIEFMKQEPSIKEYTVSELARSWAEGKNRSNP